MAGWWGWEEDGWWITVGVCCVECDFHVDKMLVRCSDERLALVAIQGGGYSAYLVYGECILWVRSRCSVGVAGEL